MLNPKHTSDLVANVLSQMQERLPGNGWDGPEARDIISLIFAQESKWRELYQVVKGGKPGTAHGLGQLEPATVRSLLTRTAHKRIPDYRHQILIAISHISGLGLANLKRMEMESNEPFLQFHLMSNIALNIALARVKLRNIPKPFPKRSQYDTQDQYIIGLGEFWNQWYNANDEHGTPREFLESARYWIRKGGQLNAGN